MLGYLSVFSSEISWFQLDSSARFRTVGSISLSRRAAQLLDPLPDQAHLVARGFGLRLVVALHPLALEPLMVQLELLGQLAW